MLMREAPADLDDAGGRFTVAQDFCRRAALGVKAAKQYQGRGRWPNCSR
jgi:hypothetical protein